ncbi:hypothetical protein R1flu_002627 [Riccia fluitans]|uniref:Very-long-chain (3R)-3-hydroxyacyl-CoA dehydratase n=1 Tax=Riccia fluitans TaxID=41844 RepID=A0ABD1Y6M6_9MARC
MAGAGSTLRWLYLSVYNVVLFFGWSQILYLAINALSSGGTKSVYAAIEKPLQIWQTAALFEIFNSIVGIVRSPVMATLPQISSRIYVTWGILYSFPETQEHWLVTSLILSWAVTEVIRYFFFALKETFGVTPPLLTLIRYSTFFVLYPTGIFSEAGLVYVALPFMKGSDLYSLRMPNKINFGFDFYYMSLLALGLYIPGGPYMYTHMISQRKKALSKQKQQ